VEKWSAPKVLKEHGMKQKSAKSLLWSANTDGGTSKVVEERRRGWLEVRNQINERQSKQRNTKKDCRDLSHWSSAERGRGGGVRSAEPMIGETIQTDERWWELRSSHLWLRSTAMGV